MFQKPDLQRFEQLRKNVNGISDPGIKNRTQFAIINANGEDVSDGLDQIDKLLAQYRSAETKNQDDILKQLQTLYHRVEKAILRAQNYSVQNVPVKQRRAKKGEKDVAEEDISGKLLTTEHRAVQANFAPDKITITELMKRINGNDENGQGNFRWRADKKNIYLSIENLKEFKIGSIKTTGNSVREIRLNKVETPYAINLAYMLDHVGILDKAVPHPSYPNFPAPILPSFVEHVKGAFGKEMKAFSDQNKPLPTDAQALLNAIQSYKDEQLANVKELKEPFDKEALSQKEKLSIANELIKIIESPDMPNKPEKIEVLLKRRAEDFKNNPGAFGVEFGEPTLTQILRDAKGLYEKKPTQDREYKPDSDHKPHF